MPPRALVTGAGGFIGANLVRRLAAAGTEVVAAVRPGGSTWRLEGLDVQVGELDLADPAATAAAVAAWRPSQVFHLAAHGAYSWERDVQRILTVNVLGTATLLRAAADAGAEVFVNAGSSSEYGAKSTPPSEDEVLEPNSAYAVGKAAATHLCALAGQDGALRVTTLRLYSAYGPWEEPARLVPKLLLSALEGRLPPLVSPSTARDFVHVDDVCDAFAAAAASPSPATIYNVASGRQTTLADLVDVVRDLVPGLPAPDWGSYPARDWDTDTWVGDPRRIASDLGWEPRRDLRTGLAQTLAWLRDAAPDGRYTAS